jgi:glycosyltransferase involved in cell wall biosynthesis
MLHKKSYVKRLREIMSRPNYSSIFVADSLRKNLKKYHINTDPSMILHSGIDLTRFKIEHTSYPNKPFTFLQVSSLKEKKGHTYTLQAFAKFLHAQSSKDYLLKLTGDGKEQEVLEQLVKELHIQDYVEFVGFVSPTQAKVLLEEADIFVHHSITPTDGDEEGIPNALMEAMAMELPVISTYHAGISELVTDGIHGYLVKEKDIATYAQRMHDILTWEKLPISRSWIAEEFEIKYHIKKLEDFYTLMVER